MQPIIPTVVPRLVLGAAQLAASGEAGPSGACFTGEVGTSAMAAHENIVDVSATIRSARAMNIFLCPPEVVLVLLKVFCLIEHFSSDLG